MPLPKNSKIVLGVSGGVAAYKACELLRLLQKDGHEVRTVMTANAEKFVGSLTFAALTNHPVTRSLGEANSYVHTHIELAQWGDVMVIAPATANIIAKIAHGIADDALTTEALAFTGKVFIAPAMNTRMWQAAATQANLAILRSRGMQIIDPEVGELACGETGEGKLASVEVMFSVITETANQSTQDRKIRALKVLVTSGPTRAYLDAVRFITNRSSGKMGHALARVAENGGASVTLVSGPVIPANKHLIAGEVISVETTEEMLEAASSSVHDADIVFAAAAASDFASLPRTKKNAKRESLSVSLTEAPDVVASLPKNTNQVFIGFAAQYGAGVEEIEKARNKMQAKGLDAIVFNDISRGDIGFDSEANEVRLITKDSVVDIPKATKQIVAQAIYEIAVTMWKDKNENCA